MPTDDGVLLDTHVVLWWKEGGQRLSANAMGRITTAATLLISPITCWEIAMLVHKERVRLDRSVTSWVVDLLAEARVQIAELTPSVAVAAAELHDFTGDPADRFLIATAQVGNVAMLTKDGPIRDYAQRTGALTAVW